MEVDDDGVDVDIEHGEDELPRNQDPSFIFESFNYVSNIVSQYGWYITIILLIAVVLWKKVRPAMDRWLDQASQARAKKDYDADQVEQRQLAMEAARRRLQDEHDKKAAEHAAKLALLEERKRQEKLEDWERHQQGRGYRSKTKVAEPEPSTPILPKTKKRLRDSDYNPLTGADGGSSTYRPSRCGPSAGGG